LLEAWVCHVFFFSFCVELVGVHERFESLSCEGLAGYFVGTWELLDLVAAVEAVLLI